jgi:hypothetical protein
MHLSMFFCSSVKLCLFSDAETLFQGVWEWDIEEYILSQEEKFKKDE